MQKGIKITAVVLFHGKRNGYYANLQASFGLKKIENTAAGGCNGTRTRVVSDVSGLACRNLRPCRWQTDREDDTERVFVLEI